LSATCDAPSAPGAGNAAPKESDAPAEQDGGTNPNAPSATCDAPSAPGAGNAAPKEPDAPAEQGTGTNPNAPSATCDAPSAPGDGNAAPKELKKAKQAASNDSPEPSTVGTIEHAVAVSTNPKFWEPETLQAVETVSKSAWVVINYKDQYVLVAVASDGLHPVNKQIFTKLGVLDAKEYPILYNCPCYFPGENVWMADGTQGTVLAWLHLDPLGTPPREQTLKYAVRNPNKKQTSG
jgi:hypothetical protein